MAARSKCLWTEFPKEGLQARRQVRLPMQVPFILDAGEGLQADILRDISMNCAFLMPIVQPPGSKQNTKTKTMQRKADFLQMWEHQPPASAVATSRSQVLAL